MTTATVNPFNSFSRLSANTVDLSDTSIQWAAHLSQNISDDAEQWQTFLSALAIAGFDQWLQEGAFTLSGSYRHDRALVQGSNFQVREHSLCILASDLGESEVSVDIADDIYWYVLVDVREELNQVSIVGGLDRARLLQALSDRRMIGRSQRIPIAYFDIEPEQLLLYLSCLEPVGATNLAASSIELNAVAEQIATGAINTGRWLQNQLGAIAEQMSWALLPLVTSTEVRAVRHPVKSRYKHII